MPAMSSKGSQKSISDDRRGSNEKRRNTLKNIFFALLLTAATLTIARDIHSYISNREVVPDRSTTSSCQEQEDNIGNHFEWDKILPSSTLNWVSCYDDVKQCARLEVPLDYSDPDGEKAAIALLKIPAKVEPAGSRYKGPVLFNPGGPGASGVGLVLLLGGQFQQILGDDYDIIGFDPRGIGFTKPAVDVFPVEIDRAVWDIRQFDAPIMNETSNSLGQIVARSQLFGDLIAENVSKVAKHVNTAVVCRDMLSIVNAHGYDKLQYWGFSYGSVLGSSFAALFPDNVGRLVVDGVVDVEDYYEGLWSTSLRDTDKGFQSVFEQCAESKGECALHEPTAAAVKERYLRILSKVEDNPIQVNMGGDHVIVRRSHIHNEMFLALYQPYTKMKSFFSALRGLEDGDNTLFWQILKKEVPRASCHCGTEPDSPVGLRLEGNVAVMCTDAGSGTSDHLTLHRHFEKLASVSQFGDLWSTRRIKCAGWKVEPIWKWKGPVAGNTSFPLLLVGNTEDPVTPGAKNVSKGFPGSVVLTQKSAGHCSLSAASLCTAKAIRQYFREGVLPAQGTVCEIEDHMFRGRTETVNMVQDEEDTAVLEALRAVRGKIQFGNL